MGNDPDLFGYPVAKLVPEFRNMGSQFLYSRLFPAQGKDTDLEPRNRKVLGNIDFGQRDHRIRENPAQIYLEDITHFLVQQAGHFLLSCTFHNKKIPN
jgi:hypothetical protein